MQVNSRAEPLWVVVVCCHRPLCLTCSECTTAGAMPVLSVRSADGELRLGDLMWSVAIVPQEGGVRTRRGGPDGGGGWLCSLHLAAPSACEEFVWGGSAGSRLELVLVVRRQNWGAVEQHRVDDRQLEGPG